MHEELLDLAKRAVAADGYYWMPGMAAWADDDTLPDRHRHSRIASDHNKMVGCGWLPDFSDPLTCQAVPLMVRAKHGVYSRAFHAGSDWVCQCQNIPVNFSGPTELAAWVAALEAER